MRLPLDSSSPARAAALRQWLAERSIDVASDQTVAAEDLAAHGLDLRAIQRSAPLHGGRLTLSLDVLERAQSFAKVLGTAGTPPATTAVPENSSVPAAVELLDESVRGLAAGAPGPSPARVVSRLDDALGELERGTSAADLDARATDVLRHRADALSSACERWIEAATVALGAEPALETASSELAKAVGNVLVAAARLPLLFEALRAAEVRATEPLPTADPQLRAAMVRFAGAIGRDEGWLDATFVADPQSTRGRSADAPPRVSTRARVDLDLSGRGLSEIFGEDRWGAHAGALRLDDNELESAWQLPQEIDGPLSLRDNAFTSLRSFEVRPIRVHGDLDLAENRGLVDLSGISQITGVRDLHLEGTPAGSLGEGPSISGKLWLDGSQLALAREARELGLPVEIVPLPARPPSPPWREDPGAASALILRSTHADRLADVVTQDRWAALPPPIRADLEAHLFARVLGDEPGDARLALRLLADHARAELRPKLEALVRSVPLDPREPIPADVARLPTATLQWLTHVAVSLDAAAVVKDQMRRGEPTSTRPRPHRDRLAELLLARARAGEDVDLSATALATPALWSEEDVAERYGESYARDVAYEILAVQARSAKLEKGRLVISMRDGSRAAFGELFPRYAEHPLNLAALDRVARSHPDSDALQAIRRFHIERGTGDVLNLAKRRHAPLVDEEIAAAKRASPALVSAREALRSLGPRATQQDVEDAAHVVRGHLTDLDEPGRGLLISELHSYDVRWGARGEAGVRLEAAALAVELLATLGPARSAMHASALRHRLASLSLGAPTSGRAEQLLARVLASRPL